MGKPITRSDYFHTIVAALIAVVAVMGAIIAWRATVASSDAGSADTRGILAAVEREETTTRATTTVIGHRTAFAAFVRDDALAKAYAALTKTNPQQTGLSDLASAFRDASHYAWDWIPPKFVERNEKLNEQRDLSENIAEDAIDKDIDPQPHFAAADRSRQKAQWLVLALVLLGIALLSLTLADAIQNLLRYLFLLAGLSAWLIGALAAMIFEFFGAPAILP